MKRILLGIILITIVVGSTIAASSAFFSDTETSKDNTFQAGAIDLKVDNQSYITNNDGVLVASPDTTWGPSDLPGHYFFNFRDLKPQDIGEDTISLHVNNNEAWACMNMNMTSNDDNDTNQPELDDGDTPDDLNNNSDGELAQNIHFIFWVDDGDNVLESNEATQGAILAQGTTDQVMNGVNIPLADSQNNRFGGTIGQGLSPDQTYYIAKAWCFGDMQLTPVPEGQGQNPTVASGITCNGANLDNKTQTDIVTADVQFTASQHRSNPNFLCNPVEITCGQADTQYATSFSSINQGKQKSGTAVLAIRSVASAMLGTPQTTGTVYDANTADANFFSLGFPFQNTLAGNVVLGFTNPFYPNPSGDDLKVFEVTGGSVSSPYPDEKVHVEVATNPAGPWFPATPSTGTRDAGFEMSLPWAQYVRLTESSDTSLFNSTADGYDVDAVQTFCTAHPINR